MWHYTLRMLKPLIIWLYAACLCAEAAATHNPHTPTVLQAPAQHATGRPPTTDATTDTTDLSPGSTRIFTSYGYGILATLNSWLIGVRKPVRQEHAKMLASKVGAQRLPQELVDIIAEELYALDLPVIQRKIDAGGDGDEFCWNVEEARVGTPVEREVQRQLDESGVFVNLLVRNTNAPLNLSTRSTTGGCVILRASRIDPHLTVLHTLDREREYDAGLPIKQPHAPDRRNSWERFVCTDTGEKFRCVCAPSTGPKARMDTDVARYQRPGRDDGLTRYGLYRFLHCGFLEEVIASWDEVAARRMVEKLGLKVFRPSAYGHDAMKPSSVHIQGFGIDHGLDEGFRAMR